MFAPARLNRGDATEPATATCWQKHDGQLHVRSRRPRHASWSLHHHAQPDLRPSAHKDLRQHPETFTYNTYAELARQTVVRLNGAPPRGNRTILGSGARLESVRRRTRRCILPRLWGLICLHPMSHESMRSFNANFSVAVAWILPNRRPHLGNTCRIFLRPFVLVAHEQPRDTQKSARPPDRQAELCCSLDLSHSYRCAHHLLSCARLLAGSR